MSANQNQVTREAKYIYADVRGNNNKYWQIQEFSNNSCFVQWGRVGANPQSQTKNFNNQNEASKFFDSKCSEKEAKGYEKLKVVSGESTVINAPNSQLVEIAAKQIQTDSPQTIELVKRLAKANIHNILSVTTLSYDTSKGTFSTPLGIVTQDAIDNARATLTQMSNFIEQKDFSNSSYIRLLNHYLKLIPQKVEGRLNTSIYSDLLAVRKQSDILDSLEGSLRLVMSNTAVSQSERMFEAKLTLITDTSIINRIKSLYRSTRQSMHMSNNLDVKRIFEIEISSMSEAFEKVGKKIGNIMELWHGTRVGNLLSILKSGFVIPPANAPHCSGRMFSNGIYCSDQSTKALNYSAGYWNGIKDDNCFMLLCDVAMGRYYVPSMPSKDLPKPGYDSTFAQGARSGVRNNEMVVYKPSQILPKFLIEFSPQGK